jgi:hyaluronoglucosaminidase
MTRAPLGIIEGFFGQPYRWSDRRLLVESLKPRGFTSWVYAPKIDSYLRDDWREAHPAHEAAELRAFGSFCRLHQTTFGVGLSPLGLNEGYSTEDKAALHAKIERLLDLGIDHLSLLFDDMRGDFPNLAKVQIEIAHDVAGWLDGRDLILCPSYYTTDPILDRVFGERPPTYLADLGAGLDPAIGLFWTGEKVCSPNYSVDHLAAISDTVRRKLTLWDNYPVNDGPRMSKKLHLRPFSGRDDCSADQLAAHLINPMSQPQLGLIPLLTLGDGGSGTDQERVHAAASALFGEQLGTLLAEDMAFVHDIGLTGDAEALSRLRQRYAPIDHPAARELIDWLDGQFEFDIEKVKTG